MITLVSFSYKTPLYSFQHSSCWHFSSVLSTDVHGALFVSEGSASPSQRGPIGFSWLRLWHSPFEAGRLVTVPSSQPRLSWIHLSLPIFQGQSATQIQTHTHSTRSHLVSLTSYQRQPFPWNHELIWLRNLWSLGVRQGWKCLRDIPIYCHSNPGAKHKQTNTVNHLVLTNTRRRRRKQLLTAAAFGGIEWTGACFCTTTCEASTLTFSPNQWFMAFAWSAGHCRHLGWAVLACYLSHHCSPPASTHCTYLII